MNKITKAFKLIKAYGLSSLCFRVKYAMLSISGMLRRRFHVFDWSDRPLQYWMRKDIDLPDSNYLQWRREHAPTFFFKPNQIHSFKLPDPDGIIAKADLILSGRFEYFFKINQKFSGGSSWHSNPFTGERVAPEKHWTQISDFGQGDIKFIWEPSRFAWAYPLVRAYAVTHDEKYPEFFWKTLENWLISNKPNRGVNFKCGQECAIRSMAICFAVYAFQDSPQTTSDRYARAASSLAVHAERIEKNISYACYQRNNHAISEANGLYTIGTLFPEFNDSGSWRKKGKQVLEDCAADQIFADGSYIQHSMNYHRVMLQNYLWAIRLAHLNGDDFSTELKADVEKAYNFVYQLQDDSGRVPNYGANDGALILPLNNCDYLDYRPLLNATHYLFNKKRLYDPELCNEDITWLFGNDALESDIDRLPKVSSSFDAGGYYTIRSNDSWAMTRCHTFNTRPGHADMLHVDMWCKGLNILRDAGTYKYNCKSLWQEYFKSTSAHNTVAVNKQSQMAKLSRFMWSDWTRSKVLKFEVGQQLDTQIFQGEHYGYCRDGNDVIHRRSIISKENFWVVVDDIFGSGEHDIDLNWNLFPAVWKRQDDVFSFEKDNNLYSITILADVESKISLLNGDETAPAGWESLYYGDKSALPALLVRTKSCLPVKFVTVVSLGHKIDSCMLSGDNLTINSDVCVSLNV